MILMMCDTMVISVVIHMTTFAAAVDSINQVSGVDEVVAVKEGNRVVDLNYAKRS